MKIKVENGQWPPDPYRCHDCKGRLGPGQPGHETDCRWNADSQSRRADTQAKLHRTHEEVA
jgi:hypothetical protein